MLVVSFIEVVSADTSAVVLSMVGKNEIEKFEHI